MGKLFINEEGFIDLRRNPPATTVTVQGGLSLPEQTEAVPIVKEPVVSPRTDSLPAIQKTADGLVQPAAGPVKVKGRPKVLLRIEAVDGSGCYGIVGRAQFDRLNEHKWNGTRTGHMYRKVMSKTGVETVLWFHREAANVNRADRFVAFKDGDERNCHHTNLKVVNTKDEAKLIRRQALERRAHGQIQ